MTNSNVRNKKKSRGQCGKYGMYAKKQHLVLIFVITSNRYK